MSQSIEIYKIIEEHDADCVFVVDNEGRITHANPAGEKTFGYTAQEFAGQILHDLIHYRRPDGSAFPRSECPLFRAYTTGETVHDMGATFIRRDGTLVPMSCSSFPVDVAGGKRAGAVVVARDITERIKAEKALTDSEQRFRLITDSMPQLVWTIAPDRKIRFANARFRQYTGNGRHIGADYASYVHPDDIERIHAMRSKALRGAPRHTGLNTGCGQRTAAIAGL